MEFGSKKKQCIASKTSETPVSGGKGWQFYASIFFKTKILDAKTKNQSKNLHTKTQGTGILVAKTIFAMKYFSD